MKRKLFFVCILMMFFSVAGFVFPSYAASLTRVYTNDSWDESKRTVNGTVFVCPQESYSYVTRSFTLRAIRNGKSINITNNFNGGTILTNGTTVYYVGRYGNQFKLYKASVTKATITEIGVLSNTAEGIDLCGYYNSKFYFIINAPEGVFARYGVKTKKVKQLQEGVTSAEWIGKKYFVLCDGTGAGYGYLGVWNAGTGKHRKVSDKPYMWKTTTKYIYYLEIKNGDPMTGNGFKASLYRCKLSDGTKKTLRKTLKIKQIIKVTDSYFQYTDLKGKSKTRHWKTGK